jgi:hypothetical protein
MDLNLPDIEVVRLYRKCGGVMTEVSVRTNGWLMKRESKGSRKPRWSFWRKLEASPYVLTVAAKTLVRESGFRLEPESAWCQHCAEAA